MVRSLILSLLITAPATGLWITKDGEQVEKPCPSVLEMSDKARLPQGCVAHVHGVWLSRKTYTDGELNRLEMEQKLKAAKEREQVLTARIESLEMQLRMQTVSTVCPACSCTSEIFTTTALAIGGCAVWTLYH
jgi:hypothetical protein